MNYTFPYPYYYPIQSTPAAPTDFNSQSSRSDLLPLLDEIQGEIEQIGALFDAAFARCEASLLEGLVVKSGNENESLSVSMEHAP
jgi:hypothetical protein